MFFNYLFFLKLKPEMDIDEVEENAENNFKEYSCFLSLKPSTNEKLGIQLVIDLIKQHKMKIHLTDIASADNLPLIRKYQNMETKKMSRLSFETSHHYLSLNSELIGKGQTEFKCSPPIRSNKNRIALWDAVKSYEVFNISSSHTPSSIKSKCLIGGKNRGNFFEASNGFASLQFGLSVFWTNCQLQNMTVMDVYRFLCYQPAKLCGFETNKGKIEVGFDADFCIWDPDEEWTVSKDDALFKNKICPYFGRTLKGRVYATIVRGFIVYDVNNPRFDEPMGNVLLKKPVKRSQRAVTFFEEVERDILE